MNNEIDESLQPIIESVRDFLNNPRYQKMKNDMEWKIRTKADAARFEAIAQERVDCARKMIKDNCSIDLIEKYTGLSKKEIKSLI